MTDLRELTDRIEARKRVSERVVATATFDDQNGRVSRTKVFEKVATLEEVMRWSKNTYPFDLMAKRPVSLALSEDEPTEEDTP